LNKIIFLLALFLVISKVNSKCETATIDTEPTTTDDAFNNISTQTRIPRTTSRKIKDSFNIFISTQTRPIFTSKFSITNDDSNQVTDINLIQSKTIDSTSTTRSNNTCTIVYQSSYKYGYSNSEYLKL
jgi:hypothetical protein